MLAMSRSFGDKELRSSGVTSEPEVTVLDKMLGNNNDDDEFIVVASDGLWDVMSSQDVAIIAKKSIAQAAIRGLERAHALQVTANVLLRFAEKKGSTDNVTVAVLDV